MKKLLFRVLPIMLVILSCIDVNAQEKKMVTGAIRSTDGTPMVGATISEKGTTNQVVSDMNGNFKIAVAPKATLTVTSIGFEEANVIIGSDNLYNISMGIKQNNLNEVVVTALGVKREKKSLGYALQEVKGETLVEAKEPNLVNDLSGKVAGLQVIRSSNGPAGSSKITLRGNNSLTGNNQPLIVVDGIPMDNFTGAVNTDFYNPSLDMGNGLGDINAEDIASLTVLKGPAASALYGSRAGNGVILITTKIGKKQNGLGLAVSSSIGFESIFANPEMQSSFGQGKDGIYDNHSNSSWGPKIAGQQVVDWSGATVPMRSYDNVGNYYGNGITSNQSVSYQQQNKSTSLYTSYSRLDDKSMIPGAKLTRNNLLARAVSKFGKDDRWTIDTKVQYNNTLANNRPMVGQNVNNSFYTIYTLPRTMDITQFKNAVDSNGKMVWFSGGGQFNPYWSSKNNLNQDNRDRFLLNGSLKYQFTNWLSAEINGGADMYTTSTETKTYSGGLLNPTGAYGLGKQTFLESNYSSLITARKDNVFGKLGGAFTLGGNLMSQKSSSLSSSAGNLKVPNLFSLNNSTGNPSISQGYSQKSINSFYGSLELNYDNYIFLAGTFRNDWSSTLSPTNRSYFYPSLSASFVFTDMIAKNGGHLPGWVSYGKLRASYASVGNDLGPYQLYNTYAINNDPNGNTTAGRNSTLFDPNVRNELIKSYEAGAEMRFFNSRLGFDLSIYKSNATHQLLNLPMDPLSGYSSKKINAGDIENKGIELMVDARILNNRNSVNWTITANYSANKNTVNSIYTDVPQYGLGGFDNVQVLAVAGQKYGEIYGSQFLRVIDTKSTDYGKLLLDGNGLPQKDGGPIARLGNQQANGLLGITNSFSYKGFGLSFLIDARFGGKIFSGTLDAMQRNGTAAVTVVNGSRDSMVANGVILNSVTNQYEVNKKAVAPQKYWGAVAGADNLGITEANLYDASNIRIRNIQLSYSLPNKLLSKTPMQKVVLSVSCNNVWLIKSYMHGIDPESVFATGTNATGFENGSAPTSRTYFVNLTVGF